MRYVAAYMLSALDSKESPTAADVEKILSSVGIESDPEKLKTVISQLSGKNLEDLIGKGMEKLATIPSGGGGGGGGGVAVRAAPPAAAATATPEKKDEKEAKKEAAEEESDDDMGFSLFDD